MINEELIYNILLYATFMVSAFVFIALFFFNAPYGRFTSKGWGLRKPKIGWFIMESPAFF